MCKCFAKHAHAHTHKQASKQRALATILLFVSRHIKSPPVSALPFYQANLISMLTMLMKMSWNIQRTISCVLFATNIKWNEKQAKRTRKNHERKWNRNGQRARKVVGVCACLRPKKEREIERPNQSDEMEIESTHYCHCVSRKNDEEKRKKMV